jgi:hypothetical protein
MGLVHYINSASGKYSLYIKAPIGWDIIIGFEVVFILENSIHLYLI